MGTGGREDLAEPLRAGPDLRPFLIHLHSFQRKIKTALGLKSGHCTRRSFAEARASWTTDIASAFKLSHAQHVNDGVATSPSPHLLYPPFPRAESPLLRSVLPGEVCRSRVMRLTYTLADPSLTGARKAGTRLEVLFHKGFVCGEIFGYDKGDESLP